MVLNNDLREWFFEQLGPAEDLCVRLGIQPVHLSYAQLVGSVFVGYEYAIGNFFLGGLLLLATSLLDVLDGRVARKTGTASSQGAFLDSMIDRYADAFALLGLAYFFQGTWVLWPVLLALVGSMNISYARARAEGLGVDCKIGLMQRAERVLFLAFGTILMNFCSLPAVLVIVLLAVLVNFTAVQRAIYVWKKLGAS